MGMLIVFAGLSLISVYIALLPKILKLQQDLKEAKHEKKAVPETEAVAEKDFELLMAIAVALHLDQASGSSYEKITWKRYEDQESPWLTTGRMRGISVRSQMPDCRS